MLSCKNWEIFKNNCFEENLPTDASVSKKQQEPHTLLDKEKSLI